MSFGEGRRPKTKASDLVNHENLVILFLLSGINSDPIAFPGLAAII